jgi:hypothetical protein
MKTQSKTKPNLVKKNLFFDQETWDIANFYAKQNQTSVAEEIRFRLADFYKNNQEQFVKDRASKRKSLAGSVSSKTDFTSDPNGATNHNDIYDS